MDSNFIRFIENKIDFIKNDDLLILIDKAKLSNEEKDLLVSNDSNYLILSKDVVGNNRHKEDFTPIEGVVNYILTSYNTKYNYFLVDKNEKFIIINEGEVLSKLKLKDTKLITKIEKEGLFLDEIEGYKVFTLSKIQSLIQKTISNINHEMICINYNELYERGKKEIFDMNGFIKNIKQDITTNYIKNKDFKKDEINFITELRYSKFYECEKNRYLIIEYLRNNLKFITDLKEEFIKIVSMDVNQVNYMCERFYRLEKYKEILKEILPELELDEDINAKRTIIKNLEYGGKTVKVNGIKVENRVCCYNGKFEMNGIKGISVNLDDIFEITYGKKILYKRELNNNKKVI